MIRDPSTNPPKAMFQLSGVHCKFSVTCRFKGLGFRVWTGLRLSLGFRGLGFRVRKPTVGLKALGL